MGVNLTPIMKWQNLDLRDLTGRSLAVDANNALHQFLSITRMADGSPFTDPSGNTTSHLIGLLFRSTKLISDYAIRLIFIFDGEPPNLKRRKIEKRRATRRKAELERTQALEQGDLRTAFSKAVMTGRLTRGMIDDAKQLLRLLGIPYLQAPGEAEAQAAYMAAKGYVWAANSQDYDSLLFGTPRLVRYVTIHGKEYLPSKGISRPLRPQLIESERLLSQLNISREKLIDIAILVGTDFNEGISGIGPKTALKLIQRYESIESLPKEIRNKVPNNFHEIRRTFLNPPINNNFSLNFGSIKEKELYEFLCGQKNFSKERVVIAIKRMRKFEAQSNLLRWAERRQ